MAESKENASTEKQSDDKSQTSEKSEAQKAAEAGSSSEQSKHERGVEDAARKEAEKGDGKVELPKVDKDYDPYQDPAVPSSAVGDVIRVELASGKGGKSATLDACRKAYKERQESN